MSGPSVLVVETVTGRITDTLTQRDGVTGLRWADTLNDSGSVDSVTVPEAVVRDLRLRDRSQGMRCSLAVERDGLIRQAGPITSRRWDWEKGEATFGASGIWALLDRRVIFDAFTTTVTLSNYSLGGLASALVSNCLALSPGYTNLPIVVPTPETGDQTGSYPVWELGRYGDKLRKITQQAVDAPDIVFRPRRRGDDSRYMEYVMQVGTVDAPALSQAGADWVFDTTAPRSPVLGISTDEDATQMSTTAWATGNGSEADMKRAVAYGDGLLLFYGWPWMDIDEAHSTEDDQVALQGFASALQARHERPIEVFKVQVNAAAAREVASGHYCQVITKGDPWLGDTDRRMRVKTVSGDLSDTVTLDMFPMAAFL